MRRRVSTLVQVTLLVCLALTPVVLSGHTHPAAHTGIERPCALCVVAYHSPVAAVVALVLFFLVLVDQRRRVAARASLRETPAGRHLGRGPPLPQ